MYDSEVEYDVDDDRKRRNRKRHCFRQLIPSDNVI